MLKLYYTKNLSNVTSESMLHYIRAFLSLDNIHVHFEIFNGQIYVYHSYLWVKNYFRPNYLGILEEVIERLNKGLVDPSLTQKKNNFISVSSRIATADGKKIFEKITKINNSKKLDVPLNIPQDATLFSDIDIESIKINPTNDLEKKLRRLFILLEEGRAQANIVIAQEEKETCMEEELKIEKLPYIPKLRGEYDQLLDNKTFEESVEIIKSLPKNHSLYQMLYPSD